jgi:hypothetical protein
MHYICRALCITLFLLADCYFWCILHIHTAKVTFKDPLRNKLRDSQDFFSNFPAVTEGLQNCLDATKRTFRNL